jgi:hypothetical protein
MTSQRRLTQILCLLILILPANALAQQPRERATGPARPPASDFKITEKTTNNGQTFSSTTLIKGARQRSEMHTGYGQDMISLIQCDLKRTIQINDKTRTYMITPMGGGDASGNSTANDTRPAPGGGVTSGGIVTYITNTVDTGERKEMFGLTARHLRSTFSIEPSPDACMKDKMRIERDGWYVDLQYGLTCAVEGAAAMGRPTMPGGCRDQVRYKNTGNAKLGYPLSETTTIYGGNGMQMSSSTKEVIELSRQPQEAALFELPSGYTEAHSFQEMYMPASEAGTAAGVVSRPRSEEPATSIANIARPGVRVGVVALNNKTGKSVSDESLRDRLIAHIIGGNVDAIRLNASSQSEADAEAKARKCDYILYTDISALKTASAGKKLGGMFGRAAGVTTSDVGKTEVKLDFKLFPTGSSAPSLSSSASGKEDSEEASMGAAIEREAQAVSAAVRRN